MFGFPSRSCRRGFRLRCRSLPVCKWPRWEVTFLFYDFLDLRFSDAEKADMGIALTSGTEEGRVSH